ncbi:MAG: tryptophan synthase subunit alpha [Flaviflexus sp.]|nr:tryptophan synthase subunit alpha [Flaviflexus sp.]
MRAEEALAKAPGSAFIAFLPAGFPSVKASIEAARTVIDAGADIVEIGLPYSDPGMDGPVIQAASQRALTGGFRVSDLFRIVEAISDRGAAIEVMSYINPIVRYGIDNFARDLSQAGGAGLITPDLIPDEAGEWIEVSTRRELDRIFLVAPSSRPDRLKLVAQSSTGFVYAASTMGVTGTRDEVDSRAEQLVADTRAAGAERVCLGLGVSTAEQARQVGAYADGVIVGSALVRALAEDESMARLATVASDIATGAHEARP